jgi:hypothetical protein
MTGQLYLPFVDALEPKALRGRLYAAWRKQWKFLPPFHWRKRINRAARRLRNWAPPTQTSASIVELRKGCGLLWAARLFA